MALKNKSFFSRFWNEDIEKPAGDQLDLIKKINFYEITVDRLALDEYDDFDENEINLDFLEGFMKFLTIKKENEGNLEDLKKFLIEKWKFFKEKKKVHKLNGFFFNLKNLLN